MKFTIPLQISGYAPDLAHKTDYYVIGNKLFSILASVTYFCSSFDVGSCADDNAWHINNPTEDLVETT